MLKVDIVKNYKKFSLRANIECESETLGLLGASGSGKSLTLKCIAGIERPDSGTIELDGELLFCSNKRVDVKIQRRRIGMLFQRYALFPNMTVLQNVMTGAHDIGDRHEQRERSLSTIKKLRIDGLENHRPHQLSGGQCQRVALARILVSNPRALLLDEPFSALDSYGKWRLEQQLCDILREFDGAALYVSHDRDEVYRLCDSVVTVENGATEQKRPVREFFSAPDTYAAALVSGCKNFSQVRYIDAHRVFALDWGRELILKAEVSKGDTQYIGARAHYLSIGPDDSENCVPGTVVRLTDNLFSRIITVDTGTESGGEEHGYLRIELPLDVTHPGLGERVFVRIPPEAIMPLKSGLQE